MASVLKVDTIKSTAGGNAAITISESGVPLLNVPAFHVRLTSNQSVTSATSTKVNFDSVEYDTNSYWDAVNFRYTPQVAGYYQFNANLYGVATGETRVIVGFLKNGDDTGVRSDSQMAANTIALVILSTSHLIYLNGTTDFVEVFGYITGTTPSFGATFTNFSGFLVRAA